MRMYDVYHIASETNATITDTCDIRDPNSLFAASHSRGEGRTETRQTQSGGSYIDDRTSDCVNVFSVDTRERKKTYKGFKYFSQGHDQESWEHTFSCLTDILFRTSHWTINNLKALILQTRGE